MAGMGPTLSKNEGRVLARIVVDPGLTHSDIGRDLGLTITEAREICETLCRDGCVIGQRIGRQRLNRYFMAGADAPDPG